MQWLLKSNDPFRADPVCKQHVLDQAKEQGLKEPPETTDKDRREAARVSCKEVEGELKAESKDRTKALFGEKKAQALHRRAVQKYSEKLEWWVGNRLRYDKYHQENEKAMRQALSDFGNWTWGGIESVASWARDGIETEAYSFRQDPGQYLEDSWHSLSQGLINFFYVPQEPLPAIYHALGSPLEHTA